MYDLHYNIRFVQTNFKMTRQETFFGFICGIVSQDNDIEQIYIDGLHNIVSGLTDEGMAEFITLLEKFSKDEDVDFIMIISKKVEDLPEVAKQYLI